jgi:hypothetical protein
MNKTKQRTELSILHDSRDIVVINTFHGIKEGTILRRYMYMDTVELKLSRVFYTAKSKLSDVIGTAKSHCRDH